MPVEGLENTDKGNAQGDQANASQQGQQANTSDATAQNTGANQNTGAATQTAQTGANNNDITQSPEFKAAVTAALEKKIPQIRRQLAKDISGEKDGEPSVAELQQQLNEEKTARQKAEARQTVRDHLNDPKLKLNIPSESQSTLVKLVMLDLEYDKDGNPSNLKEVVESLKASDPRLFAQPTSNINAGNGLGGQTAPANMNDFIRQTHAARN